MTAPHRCLTVSPIGLDIILAVSQVPHGVRLTDIATVIGSPVSSVQTALRILASNGLIRRLSGPIPRYGLVPHHPAHEQLVALATVLPEAEHAIAIIVRANPSVGFAAADSAGFILAMDDAQPSEITQLLDLHLDLIRETHDRLPAIVRIPDAEFRRMIAVDLKLRSRVEGAVLLKGNVPRTADHRPTLGPDRHPGA